jgi:hypothetical protein
MIAKWLTPELKESILSQMDYNEIDVGIRPWIVRFNQLEGIATIASCSGHFDSRKPFITLRVTRERLMEILDKVGDILITDPHPGFLLCTVIEATLPFHGGAFVILDGFDTESFLAGMNAVLGVLECTIV